jgi:hypothetical protein
MRPGFLFGVIVGIAGVFVYHKFVSPLPGGKGR